MTFITMIALLAATGEDAKAIGGGDVNDVNVDTSAGFKPPVYSGSGSFPAPPQVRPVKALHENDPCVTPGGTTLVTPDLEGGPNKYNATYTAVVDQPGHDPIRKTIGPVPIVSMATSNADFAGDTTQIAALYNSAYQTMFDSSIVSAWGDGPPPNSQDFNAPVTAADFVPPAIPAPATGGRAYADNIPEWNVKMPVTIASGRWRQDYSPAEPATYAPDSNGVQQLVKPAVPPRPLGTWRCDGFDAAWTGDPPVLAEPGAASVPSLAISGRPLQIADSVWKHWRAGTLQTMPAQDGTTYVGVPTCAWIDNTGRPNHAVDIPSKSEVTGRALRGPVTVTEYINVNVTPEPVAWNFNDPAGNPSGFEAGRGAKPTGQPHYDPGTQRWPNPQNDCPVFHQYSRVADQVTISATQWYDFKITGYFNNGAGRTELTPVTYRLQAKWDSAPLHVYQIEAVPFVP